MNGQAHGLVVLFEGHSQYGSVNRMVADCAAALRGHGAETLILDTRSKECGPRLAGLLRENAVSFILSLNGFGLPEAGQGPGLYEAGAAPVLVYFVDHPAYHFPTIRAPVPRLVLTFPTAHHVPFCRERVRGDVPIHHLSHAAAPAAPAPWEERDVGLFLSASLLCDPEPFRGAWRDHGPLVERQLNAMVEAHDAAPTRPLHEHVLAVLGVADLPIEILSSYFRTVDTYLRSRVKLQAAAALRHLPLVVCGEGWERLAAASGKARFLPSQPVEASFALMRRARIVLNPLPPYYESHERPLQAMAHGAVAANGPSPLLAEGFPGGFLELPVDAEAAALVLERALAADEELRAIAASGHAACRAGHLWEHRAARLLELAAA